MELVLPAEDPGAWLATHLPRGVAHTRGVEADVARLIAGDDAILLGACRRLLGNHVPAPAAATYLSGWFGGAVAGVVGFGLATAGAGFVVDGAELRWQVHPDGWPEWVDLGRLASVAVTAGHPWEGLDGVETVPSTAVVLSRAVGAVVAGVRPVVDACHALARVGRAGLWNEVADGLGGALADQTAVPVTAGMIAVLDAAVRVPGVPWRAKPSLRIIEASFGPMHVAQRGGCCLAYTRQHVDEIDEEALDETYRAYLERFPIVPGEPQYCTTCSLRDPDDCDARQRCWRELQHPTLAPDPTIP